MQIKLSRRHFLICLLLCSLFITSYASVLNTNGSIFPDINVFNGSSLSGGHDNSAMSSEGDSGLVDYTTAGSFLEFSVFSVKLSRLPDIKTTVNLLVALIAALIISLIYSSRLSDTICTHFDSIQITAFLHKKDGMK